MSDAALPTTFEDYLAVARLNLLANDPSVMPFIAPPGMTEIDLSPIIHEGTVVMWCPPGAIIAQPLMPGIFELHYLMPRTMTGPQKRRAAEKALGALFLKHNALMVTGKTPRENRAARFMNHAIGGRPIGQGLDSYGRDCILYALERTQWATSLGASSAQRGIFTRPIRRQMRKNTPPIKQQPQPGSASTG